MVRYERQNLKKKKYFKWLFVIISVLVLACFVTLITLTVNKYKKTMVWQKSSNIPLSEIDPSVFYLNDEQVSITNAYVSKKLEVWDSDKKDLKNKPSENQIKELIKLYNMLPTTDLKDKYIKEQEMIVKCYEIQTDYDKVFDDNNVVRNGLNPKDVVVLINHSGYLADVLNTGDSDFAKRTYDELGKLRQDYLKIMNFIKVFDNNFEVSNEKVKLKKVLTTSDLVGISDLVKDLNYKWNDLNIYTKILSEFKEIAKDNEKLLSNYESYQEELKEKQDFEKFVKEYEESYSKLKEEYENNTVVVPDFRQIHIDKVKDKARELDLKLEVSYEYDSTVSKDLVITQNISENTRVSKGSTLKIKVSRGKR